jgi:uncharacterized protein (TIGR00369 family)
MKLSFVPKDPNFEDRIRKSFARQKVMAMIGASLVTVEPGVVEIALKWREDLTQQDGYVHAGIVTTVLDSACGYAAFTLMPVDSSVLSVEFKVNLLAPARGEEIRARAEVRRSGRTLTVCSADAFADETLCATMLATIICVTKPKEK